MPVLAAPYTPPPPPAVVSWGMAGMTWTGHDGSAWDLLDVANSGVLLGPGVRGLNMPPVDRYTSKSPAVAGSRHRGSRTDEREVFWPLMIFGDDTGSQAWLEYDSVFWATMDPDKLGVWTVTHTDGSARTLTCRYSGDGDHVFENDPSVGGWAVYGLTLVAEQPYWEGSPATRSWMASPPVDFFDALGSPSFHISSGSAAGTATVDNPGDVDAWPVWTLTGPITTAAVGVAGQVVEYDVAIPTGQTRIIDTRPDRLTVVDQDGADRIDDLGQTAFAAVPAGSSVPLSIAVAGTGTVSMTLTPLYWRAW